MLFEYSCSLYHAILPKHSDTTMCHPIKPFVQVVVSFHSPLVQIQAPLQSTQHFINLSFPRSDSEMRRVKQAYTALREKSCVTYAKIAMVGRFCDLDLLVIKATSPDDFPLPEKCIYDLLKIFSHSPSSFRAFALSFTRRFGRTHSWRVALKCLVLLHRLIRSLPDNSSFRSDLLWSRSNGLISLFPCRFQDNSSLDSRPFTAFIRAYSHLLDEALNCLPETLKKENVEKLSDKFTDKMKDLGRILEVLPQLQSLLDRVIDCRPTGSAYRSFLVRTAMRLIVRDSFTCYADFRRESVVLLDSLFQMPYRNCISAFGIYKKAAIQGSELSSFYESCKPMGFCRPCEYPFIDQIPRLYVQALESFLNGMWELTDSSSPESSSPSTFTTDDSEKQLARLETVVSTEWEKFEDVEEMEPLIQLGFNDNLNWETLLEASARRDPTIFLSTVGYESTCENEYEKHWQMQVYNPNSVNPFCQPWLGSNYSAPNSPWNGNYL